MEVDSLIAHIQLVLSVKWRNYCFHVLVQKSPGASTILLKLNMLLLRSIQNECPQVTKDCHEERYQKFKALYMECQKVRFATYTGNGLMQFQITGFRSHLIGYARWFVLLTAWGDRGSSVSPACSSTAYVCRSPAEQGLEFLGSGCPPLY